MDNQQRYSSTDYRQSQCFFGNINVLIHQQWPRLTHQEVDSFRTDYARFCESIKKEYGMSQEAIDRQFHLIQRETVYAE